MNNDLINRYIYAATKRLPASIKNDVADELKGLVDDMLKERVREGVPTEKDIKIVLTELGSPDELYEKYDVNGKKCLIGSPYYTTYKQVLKTVLLCVAFSIALSSFIIQITDISVVWYENILSLISMLISGLSGAFTAVTLIFAVLYNKDIDIKGMQDLSSLPKVPSKRQAISQKECIFEIVMQILLFAVFMSAPQIFGAIASDGAGIIPIFNIETIRSIWYIIVVFALMGMTREIIKLIERNYNKKVMIVTIIANGISAAAAYLWLTHSEIINGEFTAYMTKLFQKDGAFILNIFTNFQYFFLGIILFALILDTIDCVVRSKREL